MSKEQDKKDERSPYDQQNREAERLAQELESPLGAEKLGKEAFETAKRDMAKKGAKH